MAPVGCLKWMAGVKRQLYVFNLNIFLHKNWTFVSDLVWILICLRLNDSCSWKWNIYSTKDLINCIILYYECISPLFHFTVFFVGDWFVGCVHPCQVTRRIQWCVGNFSEDCNKNLLYLPYISQIIVEIFATLICLPSFSNNSEFQHKRY